MKYILLLLLIGVIAPSCLGYRNNVPLCFPYGWPRGCPIPRCGCYQPGWGRSWTNPNVPCLVPIINGRRVPPCYGRWV